MATLSKSETRIRNIPSDHPACAGCAAQWVATPTSSRMNSDHVVLDPGRRGHRGNREDLCGFGGAEGDRTPDLMSAIQLPISNATCAVSLVFARIRLSESQGSQTPYRSQGRGNDHSPLFFFAIP